MKFAWDERKCQSNLAKHHVDFVDMQELFDGRQVVTVSSRDPAEDRFVTTGISEGRF